MRKTVLRRIACVLSVFFAAGIFGGALCSAAGQPSAQDDAVGTLRSQPLTLTYFCTLPSDAAGIVDSLSEVEAYKELEKRTSIKIAFMHPSAEDLNLRFMLMMAAGDLPDLIEMPWSKYPGLLDRTIEAGAIRKLDSLIAEEAPNLYGILRSDDDIRRQLTVDNGNIYQFPSLNRAENRAEYGPVIREDLLKKLGLAMPETIEEWEKVLERFKDQGMGKTPLSFDMSVFDRANAFIGAFGITRDFCLRDGKVVYGPLEKSYKDFLATFSRWYKNGLIDKEFVILKNAQVKNKIARGEVGAFIGTADDMGSMQEALKAVDTGYALVAAPNPVLKRGESLDVYARAWEVNPAGGIVLSSKNRHPVESVKWLDYAYSEEGYKLFNFGVEGKTYTLEGGRPTYTDLIFNNPDGLSPRQAMAKYLRVAPPLPGYRTEESIVAGYPYPEQREAVKIWSRSTNGKQTGLMPPVSLTQKENEEVSGIRKDLSTYTMEMFAKFVLGVEPLENFDTYVDRARKIGADRATQVMQAALDRYNSRLTANAVKVVVNNSALQMDTAPIQKDGRVLVPVRFVLEALGGSVTWNEENRSVAAVLENTEITLKVGSAEVLVNSEQKTLGIAVLLKNGRAYVPVEFISESLGIKAEWDESTGTVTIGK